MTAPRMPPAQALTELTRAGLRPVLDAALRRYRRTGELGRSRPELTADTWDALSRLTGRQESRTLDLTVLDAALRQSRYACSLPELLEAVSGAPVVVRRQARETFEAQWAGVLSAVSDSQWRAALGRDEGGAALLRAALRTQDAELESTLQRVSAALEMARTETLSYPVLAARLSGDAHALDADTLGGKLLRAALKALEIPEPERDGVSSTVLTANLRGPAWLNAAAGHCLALPWREVQAAHFQAPGHTLWAVENPSVFEALHAAHPHAPLLCTAGQPRAAATALLSRLPTETTVYLSCDLDLGGLRIAAYLRRSVKLNWQAWRMDAGAHALACSRGTAPLRGDPTPYSAEFPGLVEALGASGVGAHQENLLPELLGDVERGSTEQDGTDDTK
ncbi:TIGR02679 family protein [Deinococcus saxicola]|uniref:TIGR02679 domain-containing protein n=1 Tax=Deinococcus saxicola TaxID=249406 RepID=UPI0039F13492